MPDGILGQAMLEGRVESKYSVTSNQLYIIIDNLPKRDNEAARVFEIIKTLRDVEREIRNKAAHQMVSVTDEKIKKFDKQKETYVMLPKEVMDYIYFNFEPNEVYIFMGAGTVSKFAYKLVNQIKG